ncbi:uncharacterized protein LOC133461410 [Cololabis saira]|uniref:uncharacterized protein LOC133461410 n=1 Tax=Cololabis saira TaxID=129043 RepID=UPI002AD270CD|nr:uncharacterized protein LOC133461410 [Cololabis saira]
MALLQAELLLVLSGTVMLLVPVQVQGSWVRINHSDLLRFYSTGQWGGPDTFTGGDTDCDKYEDDISKGAGGVGVRQTSYEDQLGKIEDEDIEYDSYEDEVPAGVGVVAVSETSPEDAFLEVEGVSTVGEFDYDDYEDKNPDTKGVGTIEMTDQVGEVESDTKHWPDATASGFQVLFVDVPPRSWTMCTTSTYDGIRVVCSEDGFHITLPPGLLTEVQVVGLKNISVMDAHKYCGYHVNHANNTLTIPFTGCNVREDTEDIYSLQLSVDVFGRAREFTVFCVESMKFDSGLFPRAFSTDTNCNKLPITPTVATPKPTKCAPRTTAPLTTGKPATVKPSMLGMLKSIPSTAAPASTPHNQPNCAVHTRERLPCGHLGISASNCKKRGCCADLYKPACYYQLDECTVDQHFVFAIRNSSASIPVDPKTLVIPGKPLCKPAIVNDKVAIFKIKFRDCGARSYDIGEVKIHLIEVHTAVHVLNLKYGLITRTDPIRFLIECRYKKHGITQQSMASVGYMVKTTYANPRTSITKMPPAIISNSPYGVELRLAKDHTYSSYFPTHHQPLRVLLGHPVYLELILNSPAPDAVILVNYCLAYPDSASNALVLVYEGCANPNDPTVAVLKVKGTPNNHQRRFVVNAFHFMDQKTSLYLNEEINFMCSVEVCRPSEKMCEERCFDGKESGRLEDGRPASRLSYELHFLDP